jgi:hypothetical protein
MPRHLIDRHGLPTRQVVRRNAEESDRAELLPSVEERKDPKSIGDMVHCLWAHVGAVEEAFRRRSMDVFISLCHLLPDLRAFSDESPTASARQWVLRLRPEAVVSNAEKGVMVAVEKLGQPEHSGAQHSGIISDALDNLTAALDAYTWLFETRILRPRALFEGSEAFEAPREGGKKRKSGGSPTQEENARPRALAAVRQVVEHLWKAPEDYEKALGLLPSEAMDLRRKNAKALRQVLDFFTTLLRADSGYFAEALVASGAWGEPLQLLLLWSLFRPWHAGVFSRPEEDEQVALMLPSAAERLLAHWQALEAGGGQGTTLTSSLRRLLGDPVNGVDVFGLADDLEACDGTDRACIARGCRILAQVGLLRHALEIPAAAGDIMVTGEQGPQEVLACHLARRLAGGEGGSSPSAQRTAATVFHLTIALGLPYAELVRLLGEGGDDDDGGKGSDPRGLRLYRRFALEVNEALAAHSHEARSALEDLLRGAHSAPHLRVIFMGVVDYLLNQRSTPVEAVASFLQLAARLGPDGLIPSGDWPEDKDQKAEACRESLFTLSRLLRLRTLLPRGRRAALLDSSRVATVVADLLKDKDLAVAVKVQALALLVFLLPGSRLDSPLQYEVGGIRPGEAGEDAATLISGANKLMFDHFPPPTTASRVFLGDQDQPSEDPERRRQHADYALIMRASLRVVAQTGSLELVWSVLKYFREGRGHFFFPRLADALREWVAGCIADGDVAKLIAAELLRRLLHKSVVARIKLIVLDEVLSPLLERFSRAALEDFFLQPADMGAAGVTDATLLGQLVKVLAAGEGGGDETIMAQACAFDLLRVLHERIPAAEDRTRVASRVLGPQADGKQLLAQIIKPAQRIVDSAQAVEGELPRRRCTSAYRCITTCILMTQEDPRKIQFWVLNKINWRNIVSDKVYDFKIKESGSNRLLTDASMSGTKKASAYNMGFRFRVGGTQAFGSTLSLMVSQSSLSQAPTPLEDTPAAPAPVTVKSEEPILMGSVTQLLAEVGVGDEAGGMGPAAAEAPREVGPWAALSKLNGLNREVAMPCLMATIEKLHRLHLQSLSDDDKARLQGDRPPPMPDWVSALSDVIRRGDQHPRNVRLFVLQALLNEPVSSSTAPWCADLGADVLELILQEGGKGFNYLVSLTTLRLIYTNLASSSILDAGNSLIPCRRRTLLP